VILIACAVIVAGGFFITLAYIKTSSEVRTPLYLIEVVLQFLNIAVLGMVGLYFMGLQTKINNTLKGLEDVVAVTVLWETGTDKVNILNVGKVILYLNKYDIGKNTEIFSRSLLIPASGLIRISLHDLPVGEMDMQLYLTDDFKRKYKFEGKILVEEIEQPYVLLLGQTANLLQGDGTVTSGVAPVQNKKVKVLAIHPYKTEQYDWKL